MFSQNSQLEFEKIKRNAEIKIKSFLKNEFIEFINNKNILKKIDEISDNTVANLQTWMSENIPERYKKYILKNIYDDNWSEIIEAFKQELTFGTSGIRGKLTPSLNEKKSYLDLKNLEHFGFESEILRGPNTINEITLLKNIYGLMNYLKKNNMSKIVVGFDSRVLSKSFSHLITNLFLTNNFFVILFDFPNSTPELSFAVVDSGADMGIEITASHNDKRYNGYKLITKHGGPPSNEIRDEIAKAIFKNRANLPYELISNTINESIFDSNNLILLKKSQLSQLSLISQNSNEKYLNHIENLIFDKKTTKKFSSDIRIGYSALHGTGYTSVSKLLRRLGVNNMKYVTKMIHPDSLFPMFDLKQILDPSDKKTASIVVNEFINQYDENEFSNLDVLAYTDPDADRLGIIVKTLSKEESIYGKWRLLRANDIWLLLLWYILEIISKINPKFSDHDKLFIVKSFVTSDSLLYIAKKYHLECIDGNVGFSDLAKIVQQKWNDEKINIGIFEESCGFGLAGNPEILKLHVLEKDGILSLALIIEIISYAKSKNSSLQELLDIIYLDSNIGFFSTFRRELPENGIFEGVQDEYIMENILKNVEKFYAKVLEKIKNKNPMKICGLPITAVQRFSTGKYDSKFWENFPDEGIRFFLNSDVNHITIRPSGTESKIRIFVQCRITNIHKNNLIERKSFGENLTKRLSYKIEKLISLS